MGIGSTIISISFLIIFGGVILALSLAVGIGVSGLITDFIKDKVSGSRSRKKRVEATSDHYGRPGG